MLASKWHASQKQAVEYRVLISNGGNCDSECVAVVAGVGKLALKWVDPAAQSTISNLAALAHGAKCATAAAASLLSAFDFDSGVLLSSLATASDTLRHMPGQRELTSWMD